MTGFDWLLLIGYGLLTISAFLSFLTYTRRGIVSGKDEIRLGMLIFIITVSLIPFMGVVVGNTFWIINFMIYIDHRDSQNKHVWFNPIVFKAQDK